VSTVDATYLGTVFSATPNGGRINRIPVRLSRIGWGRRPSRHRGRCRGCRGWCGWLTRRIGFGRGSDTRPIPLDGTRGTHSPPGQLAAELAYRVPLFGGFVLPIPHPHVRQAPVVLVDVKRWYGTRGCGSEHAAGGQHGPREEGNNDPTATRAIVDGAIGEGEHERTRSLVRWP
jgi:hypothetical protein